MLTWSSTIHLTKDQAAELIVDGLRMHGILVTAQCVDFIIACDTEDRSGVKTHVVTVNVAHNVHEKPA